MLIFYLVLSIGVSFMCSLFEAVILSITPAYAASLKDSGSKAGIMIEKLKTNLDDSLSAILTLNTFAHTIGAAGVGAEVLKIYGNEYVGIASGILTLLVLVLSEIIPKTLGATHYRAFTLVAAYGIQFFIYITYPFVFAFKYLARYLGSGSHLNSVTRDELLFSAELGEQDGNLSADELVIIKNLLRLKKVKVKDVMTPRVVVFALPIDMTVEEVLEKHPEIQFSRIPLYRDQIDNVVGLLNRYELLQALAEDRHDLQLSELLRPVTAVSDNFSIGKVYQTFKQTKEHLFIVNDEHGGFDGVISFEDVIETLLGIEITDEFDTVDDLREFAAKQWERKKPSHS